MKYNVDITLDNGTKILSVVNVICEEAPHKPRRWGEWGVNPQSVQNIVSKIGPKSGKGKATPKKKPASK